MGLTSYMADVHGDVSYINAHNTVMNHLKGKYGVEVSSVISGDIAEETNKMGGVSKADQYDALKKSCKSFKGQFHVVEGNHDKSKDLNSILCSSDSNVKYSMEDEKINGKNHMGLYHSDANAFEDSNPEENDYKGIKDNMKFIDANIAKTDIVVMHDGIKGCARSKTYHTGLAEKIEKNNANVASGHSHKEQFVKIGDSYHMVSCATPDLEGVDNKTLYLRLSLNGKDKIYELKNSEMRKWADQINPKGNHKINQDISEDSKRIAYKLPPQITGLLGSFPEGQQYIKDNVNTLMKMESGYSSKEEANNFMKKTNEFIDPFIKQIIENESSSENPETNQEESIEEKLEDEDTSEELEPAA